MKSLFLYLLTASIPCTSLAGEIYARNRTTPEKVQIEEAAIPAESIGGYSTFSANTRITDSISLDVLL